MVYYNAVEDKGAIVWDESISDTAEVIASASGPSGANIEYLRNLVMGIRQLGVGEDPYLESLLNETEKKLPPSGDLPPSVDDVRQMLAVAQGIKGVEVSSPVGRETV